MLAILNALLHKFMIKPESCYGNNSLIKHTVYYFTGQAGSCCYLSGSSQLIFTHRIVVLAISTLVFTFIQVTAQLIKCTQG